MRLAAFADVGDRLRRQRQHLVRIALQTATAAGVCYGVMTWFDLPDRSWAIIVALLTIGVSADATYRNAVGRAGGAVLGAGLGWIATLLFGEIVVLGLILAATSANLVATLWPSLNYAAVTAAVVSLDARPDMPDAFELVIAVIIGTIVGTAVSFLIWPLSSRQRVMIALRHALNDCRDLLQLFDQDLEGGENGERDDVHGRFLSHLEQARGRLSETRFMSRLPKGAKLRDAVNGVESLWHALVIFDRVFTGQRQEIDRETLRHFHPTLTKLHQEADDCLANLIEAMQTAEAQPVSAEALGRASRDARAALQADTGQHARGREARTKALNALMFALDETERSLRNLTDVLAPPGWRR